MRENHHRTARIAKPEELFGKFAKEYAIKYARLDLYSPVLDKLSQYLKPQARILDAACGPGNVSGYIARKRKDISIDYLDVSAEMLDLCIAGNPGGRTFHMDIMDISRLETHYGAVILGFALPYLKKEDLAGLFASCCNQSDKDGLLYLSTMISENYEIKAVVSSRGDEALMTHFHTETNILSALAGSAYRVVEKMIINNNSQDELIVLAQKIN